MGHPSGRLVAATLPAMLSELTIAFDADDTLWHNEAAFYEVEQLFGKLMEPWSEPDHTQTTLVANERERVKTYGYGVKSFAISMIATACELSAGQVDAATIGEIIAAADRLLAEPTRLIDGAAEAMAQVAGDHPTMIITKGDLHHQSRRLQASGLTEHCFDIEVVGEKDTATYRRILGRHRIEPQRFVMVGNSIVSDVAPILELGGRAIHVPYEITWALEQPKADPPASDRWHRVEAIRQVPDLIAGFAAELTADVGTDR